MKRETASLTSVLGALDVLVETVVGVGAGHVVQVGVDQGVLDEVLDVLDLGGTVVALRDLAFDLVGEARISFSSSGPTCLSRSAKADFTALMMFIGSKSTTRPSRFSTSTLEEVAVLAFISRASMS